MRDRLSLLKSKGACRSLYLIVVLPDKSDDYVEDFDDAEERQEIYEWWVAIVVVVFVVYILTLFALLPSLSYIYLDGIE